MLHGFASPVQKTDSFLQPAIFDPINIRLPAFKQIAENSGLVYLSRRTLNSNSRFPSPFPRELFLAVLERPENVAECPVGNALALLARHRIGEAEVNAKI